MLPPMGWVDAQLEDWTTQGLARQIREVSGSHGSIITLDGRAKVINFCSNSYLGLESHPLVCQAAQDAAETNGVGSGASRLIVGTNTLHAQVEAKLAAFHQTDAALVFNSGYNANVGILPALLGAEDIVFSDQQNHASIIDGCRLSRAKIEVYEHNHVKSLEACLRAKRKRFRRALVVTDSVFSMDGDLADITNIAEVCKNNNAILMVDEAHATGILGESGQGYCAALGVKPDIHVGTLSKAMGCFGGYVVGERNLLKLLLNTARSFVFTTALPAPVMAAASSAIDLLRGPEGVDRRQALQRNIAQFSAALQSRKLLVPGTGRTPIFPIIVGSPQAALVCSKSLLERGIFIQAIRPPTVPRGTSRLRVTLMATHTEQQINWLLEELDQLANQGLVPRNLS